MVKLQQSYEKRHGSLAKPLCVFDVLDLELSLFCIYLDDL